MAPLTGTSVCSPCASGTKGSPLRERCVCDTGSYNGTEKLVVCFNKVRPPLVEARVC